MQTNTLTTRQTRNTFTLRHAAIAALTAGSLGLCAAMTGGCQGHGAYTKEHVSGAKAKMSAVKSATEYQISHQAFLAGDIKKALKHADYSIGLNDQVAKTYVLKGRILTEIGDIEQAALSLAKAVELDSKNVDAAYFQGILAERIGRREEALARYQAAAELDTTNAQYAIAAAEMMIELDRADEARTYLTERQDKFSHSAGVRQTLGHIAVLQNKHEDAIALFKEARLLNPEDLTILEDIAHCNFVLRRFGDAEAALAKVLKNDDFKARRDLRHMRVDCLVHLDRAVDARNFVLELTTGDEGANDTAAWITLGQLSYELRDTSRLREAASRVVALAPERAEGYLLRGLAARRVNDLKTAKMNFEKAASITPDADTITVLGMTYKELGEIDHARTCFTALLQKDPSNTVATSMLAELNTNPESPSAPATVTTVPETTTTPDFNK